MGKAGHVRRQCFRRADDDDGADGRLDPLMRRKPDWSAWLVLAGFVALAALGLASAAGGWVE